MPAMTRLAMAALDADPGEGAALVELLAGRAGDSELVVLVEESSPTDRIGAAREPGADVAGVLLGRVRAGGSGERTGYVDLLAVDRGARRRGVARRLVAAAETRFAQLGATTSLLGSTGPYYAWPGIDTGYPAMLALADALGYQPCGEATNLGVALDAADLSTGEGEERLRRQGVVVRRARSAAEAGLVALVASFGGSWTGEVAAALEHVPPRCYLAERDGSVVGFAVYGTNRTDWFGPMGTRAEERGRGIATVLLRRCLADLRDTGARTAQVAWAGPVEFYARAVGARPGRRFWRYARDLR